MVLGVFWAVFDENVMYAIYCETKVLKIAMVFIIAKHKK
jgi:hypothetical protein